MRKQRDRRVSRARLRSGAKPGWDELELPPEALKRLKEIARRAKKRARLFESWSFGRAPRKWTTVLFTGPWRSGQSIAAVALARAIGRDLHRIDLSAVVSEYLGETEKNLRRIFDAAERADWVLWFDEADALFGRRGGVRDARDRRANLDLAQLLARMERHAGVSIVATHRPRRIDAAFLRRFTFVVPFPRPRRFSRKRT